MNQKLVAKLQFDLALRAKWPATVLTAEARAREGAWSMRAELWAPPDSDGTAFAWLSFLSEQAPMNQPGGPILFDVTLGRTRVASCQIVALPTIADVVARDTDFLDHPEQGLRTA